MVRNVILLRYLFGVNVMMFSGLLVMAVVIAASDLKAFLAAADAENMEATVVAEVSNNPRLVMYWHGYEYTGVMKVLETILRYEYLWTKIRVQGGAYGANVLFDRNGGMYLSSYRDPKLAETLTTYKNVPAFLKNFTASDREMDKYIIGTISSLDTPLTNSMVVPPVICILLISK